MESLDNPNDRATGLLALRTVAEAYGGLGVVAAEAGISRQSLYRAVAQGPFDAQNAVGRVEDGWHAAVGRAASACVTNLIIRAGYSVQNRAAAVRSPSVMEAKTSSGKSGGSRAPTVSITPGSRATVSSMSASMSGP